MSNTPKVLVEFDPDEIKWIADHFHDVFTQISAVKMSLDPNSDVYTKLEAKQKMAARFMNRLVDNASDQGFGDL